MLKTAELRKILLLIILIVFHIQNAWSIEYNWQELYTKDSMEFKRAENFVSELEKLHNANEDNKLMQKINQINNFFDLSVAAEWLRGEIITGRVDARYCYLYSSSLLGMRNIMVNWHQARSEMK